MNASETTQELWSRFLGTPEKNRFFEALVRMTIEALLAAEYTCFDGHTTANCCHGLSLHIQKLIASLRHQDLKNVFKNPTPKNLSFELVELTSLFCLHSAKMLSSQKTLLTCSEQLKHIAPAPAAFCRKLIRTLQKHFARKIALNYAVMASNIPKGTSVNNVPVELWKKHITHENLRTTSKGWTYAPTLFSVQVVLAEIITSKKLIAILVDMITPKKHLVRREIKLYRGNGIDKFEPLPNGDLVLAEPYDLLESVTVFSGFATQEYLFLNDLIQPEFLILACDIFYPQFPSRKIDPLQNEAPILPKDQRILRVFEEARKVTGITVDNPSRFFLSHIYSCSLGEALRPKKLPECILVKHLFDEEKIPPK